MKDGNKYFAEALGIVASGGAAEGESASLSLVAARHVLSLLSGPSEGPGTTEAPGEREREVDYLSWVAEREADKLARRGEEDPVGAYRGALSTRRFLEAYLFVLPLAELERELDGVPLPDFAVAARRNRLRRRSSPEPVFGFDPVTAQIYVRNRDTEETLKAFCALSGRPESAVAKEAVALGARAMAGAVGVHMPPEDVAAEAEENARLKDEAAERIGKAALLLRENGWTA